MPKQNLNISFSKSATKISPFDLVSIKDHRGSFSIIAIDVKYPYVQLTDYVEILGLENGEVKNLCVNRLNITSINKLYSFELDKQNTYNFILKAFKPDPINVGDFVLYMGGEDCIGIVSSFEKGTSKVEVSWFGNSSPKGKSFPKCFLHRLDEVNLIYK